MKEDILEQVVADYLQAQGYFTRRKAYPTATVRPSQRIKLAGAIFQWTIG